MPDSDPHASPEPAAARSALWGVHGASATFDDSDKQLVENPVAAIRAHEHFIQVASHDLREPLRMVAGFCGLVLRDYGGRLDERGRDYLARAVSATVRMNTLVEALADFAVLGAKTGDLAWFDSGDSLDEALERLDDVIRARGAKITRDALPRLFGCAPRFPSLFQNLIGNALKHAPPGVAPEIHVSAVRTGKFWRISVSDNGVGISAEDQARIFEPFVRLAPASAGAGLGLAICRTIVGDWGGRIWVRSKPGKGSTFEFTIRVGGPQDGDGQSAD